MDATIHTLIASQHIQGRIAEATSAREARTLTRRRNWTRKVRRLPTATPRATALGGRNLRGA
jgi:hypothetical protein